MSSTNSSTFPRKELIRIVIQTLQALNLDQSAQMVAKESKTELEPKIIQEFRAMVHKGNWPEAIQKMDQILQQREDFSSILEEDNSYWQYKKDSIKFILLRHQYFEHLLQHQIPLALQCLRNEITPLVLQYFQTESLERKEVREICSTKELHYLASFLILNQKDFVEKICKYFKQPVQNVDQFRSLVFDLLSNMLPSHILVPDNCLQRFLQTIMDMNPEKHIFELLNVQNLQQMNFSSAWNNSNGKNKREHEEVVDDSHIKLSSDLLRTSEEHEDEVWFCKFSPNGKYLASCSSDHQICLYSTNNLLQQSRPLITKVSTSHPVSFLSWSPDSSNILACVAKEIYLYNVNVNSATGAVSLQHSKTFSKHKDNVCAVAWFPDSIHFVSCGERNDKTIRRWNCENGSQVGVTWRLNYRIHDMALSKDGTKLIVLSHYKKLFVYYVDGPFQQLMLAAQPVLVVNNTSMLSNSNGNTNGNNNSQMSSQGTTASSSQPPHYFSLISSEYLSQVALSDNGRYAMCNISREEDNSGNGGILLFDLQEKKLVQEFSGHTQSKYVLRTCFAGNDTTHANRFVVSGSENGKLYIWSRETAKLLFEEEYHTSTINCVDSTILSDGTVLLATAADDNLLKMFTLKMQE